MRGGPPDYYGWPRPQYLLADDPPKSRGANPFGCMPVLFDACTAAGTLYRLNNSALKASCVGWAIVSAGGIDLLRDFNIPVIHNSPDEGGNSMGIQKSMSAQITGCERSIELPGLTMFRYSCLIDCCAGRGQRALQLLLRKCLVILVSRIWTQIFKLR